MGVRPNTARAKEPGIELGGSGSIHVNKRLETSMPDMWATGDCAESYHPVSEKRQNVMDLHVSYAPPVPLFPIRCRLRPANRRDSGSVTLKANGNCRANRSS